MKAKYEKKNNIYFYKWNWKNTNKKKIRNVNWIEYEMDLFINVRNLIKYNLVKKKIALTSTQLVRWTVNSTCYIRWDFFFHSFFLYYYLNRCILNFKNRILYRKMENFYFHFLIMKNCHGDSSILSIKLNSLKTALMRSLKNLKIKI